MNLAIFIAAALLAIVPHDIALGDRVDLIEVNHFHCTETGREIFVQLVFWDWDRLHGRHQVVDWRLLKSETLRPAYDFERRCYRACWFDGERFREVTAPTWRETWTMHDPELAERERLAVDQRRKLASP